MRPPKRSPFLHSRQADLFEVYRHLYPDSQGGICAKARHEALSTVQLWINRSACPFAVETTALLVQSVIMDEFMQQIATSTSVSTYASTSAPHYALEQMGGGAELGVRLNYSLALVRFVNSVVDSHQTGGFAQSIAAIAARIGLPLWFVEIRHAVTHEELPSIGVCRQAAGSALTWLQRHFWIPQLFEGPNSLAVRPGPAGNNTNAMDVDRPDRPAAEASSSAIGSASTIQYATSQEIHSDEQEKGQAEQDKTRRKERSKALQDLRQTLKSYRQLAKKVTRDRSLISASKNDFHRLYKHLAVFVSRIRTLEPDFGTHLVDSAKKGKDEEIDVRDAALMDPDDVDECTKSALSDLVNQLVQPGGLIPLGKSKRVQASATDDEIILPAELASLWSPLLGHLRDTFGPIFGQLLTEELVEAAIRETDSNEDLTTPPTHTLSTAEDAVTDDQQDPSSQSWKRAAYASASYRKTADAWVRYLVTVAPPASSMSRIFNASTGRAPTTLITDTEVAEMCLPFRTLGSVSILDFLCERNSDLKARIGALVSVLKVSSFVATAANDLDSADDHVEAAMVGQEQVDEVSGFESQLQVMQKRLLDIEALAKPDAVSTARDIQAECEDGQVAASGSDIDTDAAAATSANADRLMPTGWFIARADWKPTPFGCLRGRIPDLVV